MSMAGESDQHGLRSYLLGLADEETREAIELRLLSDPALLEEVEAEEWDLIDDHLAGELASDEERAFAETFLRSPGRRSKVTLARGLAARTRSPRHAATTEEASGGGLWASLRALFGGRLALGGGLAVLLIALFFGGWYLIAHRDTSDAVIAELDRAYTTERPLEGRITGLGHAPKTDRRGGEPLGMDTLARNRAERIASDNLAEQDSDAARHGLARVYLAKGEVGEALRLLERVTRQQPENAQALSDLGVAYMESAAALEEADGGRKMDFYARALTQFERSISADPKLAEPRFNRALVLGHMGTSGEEANAWRDYLKLDSSSPWAQEARERLAALENAPPGDRSGAEATQQFLTAFRQRDRMGAFEVLRTDREMITGKLIPQQLAFLFADAPDEASAAPHLAALVFAGDVEFERTGDPFWKELAAFYSALPEPTRLKLREPQSRVRSGYKNSLDGRYEQALADFQAAHSAFDSFGDAWDRGIADYWLGYLLDRNGRLEEAEAVLKKAAANAERQDHFWIGSHHLAWIAQVAYARDRPSERIKYGIEALALAERTFDDYNTQKTLELLAAAHRDVGAFEDALTYARRGTQMSRFAHSSPRQRYRTLSETAKTFANAQYYAAAEAFQIEALNVARNETTEGTFVYLALLRLGQLATVRREFDRAFEWFPQSRDVANGFEAEERARHLAYLDISEGHAFRAAGRCHDALPRYLSASAYYARDKFTTDHYDTEKGRLICHLTQRDEGSVALQAPVVFGMLERYRTAISEEAVRNSFFGREQEIYDALIDFELSRGNADAAFGHVESSRARSLLDSLENRGTRITRPADSLPARFHWPR
jgi:tetratricopeptide (TPR) repeat protein